MLTMQRADTVGENRPIRASCCNSRQWNPSYSTNLPYMTGCVAEIVG